jgi:2-C-methyl-D-erythritol 4-phosphate cytidylyltransferase
MGDMNIALVLAGGTGTRLGMDIPKQYIKINGRMIVDYCLETLEHSLEVDAVWIVADKMWQQNIKKVNKFKGFASPGMNRQLSIYNGLKAIEASLEVEELEQVNVIIHDAARPLLTEKLISECVKAIEGHDGVLPVLPMKDTVYFSEDGENVTSLIDRGKVYAGQAPELFKLMPYIKANEVLLPDKILLINGSTEPAVMAGMDIVMIPGDENNYKITTKADMERFEEKV